MLLKALTGAAPLLAPGILALAGVLAIAATAYHPALQRAQRLQRSPRPSDPLPTGQDKRGSIATRQRDTPTVHPSDQRRTCRCTSGAGVFGAAGSPCQHFPHTAFTASTCRGAMLHDNTRRNRYEHDTQ